MDRDLRRVGRRRRSDRSAQGRRRRKCRAPTDRPPRASGSDRRSPTRCCRRGVLRGTAVDGARIDARSDSQLAARSCSHRDAGRCPARPMGRRPRTPPLGHRRAAAASRIAGGDFAAQLGTQADPDLDRVAVSFNSMADALKLRIERDARFVSDVTHELRSPLTTLAAAADVLRTRADELPSRARSALELVVAEIDRLREMVEELLELSRAEDGHGSSTARAGPRRRARSRCYTNRGTWIRHRHRSRAGHGSAPGRQAACGEDPREPHRECRVPRRRARPDEGLSIERSSAYFRR